jgi:bacitracin synthase 3
MASEDSNNSYWAQKLHRFKEGSHMFPAQLPGAVDGARSLELPMPVATSTRLSTPVYIGALALLVARYSAKDEVLIAEPGGSGAGKRYPLFYTLEARTDWSIDSFVAHVEAEIDAAREHLPYAYDALAALLGISEQSRGGSVFQVSFSETSGDELRSPPPDQGLLLSIEGVGRQTRLVLSYCARHFRREWAEQFGRLYLRVLSLLASGGEMTLGELDLLSRDEKRRVAVDFNRTERERPLDKTLHLLVEEQARKTPLSTAVIFGSERLTYRELNEQANRLAHFLRESLDVRTGDIVGVLLRRSEKMVVTLLAILKAGAAYVPINPKHPWATVNYMIDNAGIKVLVVDTDSVSQAATFGGGLFIVDVELDLLDTPTDDLEVEMSSADLAYVIYTSGSTGRPKGVAIEHRSIVNTILWRNEFYRIDEADVNLQMPSYAFDSSVLDIFCVLCVGGCLVIPDEELRLDAAYLKEVITTRGVTRVILTPSYYRVLMRELGDGGTLRSITVAGESTTVELVEEHAARMPGVALYNEYGPTENAVCSTACVLRPGSQTVSIGKPVSNVKVFIMDEGFNLLPPGMPGEIFLGGAGVARGYLNQEAMTAERFIESPLRGLYDGRLYRTGDWGYWNFDGELEFLGRVDNQVKVRGFRIELDEIENRLSHHALVESAAVVCKGEGGDRYIAAYVVCREGLTAADLRDYLGGQLPHYMVPEVISMLAELPLTFNGKVDRNLLKSLDDHQESGGLDAPGSETESAISKICSDLLKRTRLGANDNFFDNGFNSLKVMEMVSRIRNELEVEISLLDVYTFPTINALSRRIGATRWKPQLIKTKSST